MHWITWINTNAKVSWLFISFWQEIKQPHDCRVDIPLLDSESFQGNGTLPRPFPGHRRSNGNGSTSEAIPDSAAFEIYFSRVLQKVYQTIERNDIRLAEQDKKEGIKLEWQQVAQITDRLLLTCFVCVTLTITGVVLLASPASVSVWTWVWSIMVFVYCTCLKFKQSCTLWSLIFYELDLYSSEENGFQSSLYRMTDNKCSFSFDVNSFIILARTELHLATSEARIDSLWKAIKCYNFHQNMLLMCPIFCSLVSLTFIDSTINRFAVLETVVACPSVVFAHQ